MNISKTKISSLLALAIPLLLMYARPAAAQTPAYEYLNGNSINARFNSDGQLFWDGKKAYFETPKGSGRNTLSAAALWIGGKDNNGDLHVAAQTYRETGSDFWAGPLDTVKGGTDTANYNAYNHIWKVSKLQIDSFRAGLSKPVAIMQWPGNGNNAKGYSRKMAPYVDLNNNGIYEPLKGEYPDIKGDLMLWWVFNDKMYLHGETQGKALGVEVQASAYTYNCPDDPMLSNSIFLSYKIINRSGVKYDSVYAGLWSDLDIGNIFDDYVGFDSSLKTYYGYNGDNNDQDTTVTAKQGSYSYKGFGKTLPAQSVTFLKGINDDKGVEMPLSHFIYFNNDESIKGNPKVEGDYYNFLKGVWFNGTPLTYGGDGFIGTVPANFAFNGDPEDPTQWSEISAKNKPGDRRGLASYGPFTLKAGEAKEFTAAFSFHLSNSGKTINSIRLMKNDLARLNEMYKKGLSPCTGINVCVNKDSCVHPGDANNDGLALGDDPFNIGYAYGSRGPKRQLTSLEWIPQPSANWGKKFPDGTDYKYADCNGDGVIDSLDIIPVAFNIDKVHAKNESMGRASDPELKVNVDKDTAIAGSIVHGSVSLGDEDVPADNVYGVTFTMNFDPDYVDKSTFKADVTGSELGSVNELLQMTCSDTSSAGIVITVVRKDTLAKKTKGIMLRWQIVPEVNVAAIHVMPIKLEHAKVVDNYLHTKPVRITNTTTVVKALGIKKYTDLSGKVSIYPNPGRTELNIDLSKLSSAQVKIMNLQGTVIKVADASFGKAIKLDISGLPDGMYLVDINSPDGHTVQKFSKIR